MKAPLIQAMAVALQANVPMIVWGGPGLGKTRTFEALGKALGLEPVVTVIAGIHDPVDFAGLPFYDAKTKLAVYAPPGFISPLIEAKKGILFMDEFNSGPAAVEAACMRVVYEGVVGEVRLPPDVRRVAAANPPDVAVAGRELSLPMSNRFLHLEFDLDSDYYVRGMVNGYRLPDLPRLPEGWASRIPGARKLVAAFLKLRPSLIYAPPKDPPFRSWPSPRTWYDYAAVLLAACEASGASDDVTTILLEGAVGGAAWEFWEWRKNLDLPDPREYLANPKKALPKREDKLLALLLGLVELVGEGPEEWDAAWCVIGRAAKSAPDTAALPALVLLETKRQYKKEYQTPHFAEAMSRFGTVFEEVGRG